MKITLIRHGESVANVGNFISDDPRKPVGLTDRGRAQAESLAQRLRAEIFSHAYASEFPRARETAGILLRHHSYCRRVSTLTGSSGNRSTTPVSTCTPSSSACHCASTTSVPPAPA